MEKLCAARERCSKNSASTHWFTIGRLLKIQQKKDSRFRVQKLPKTSSWIKPALLDKLDGLSLVTKRNLITSAVVYLQLTKASKTLIKTFSNAMYDTVKKIRKQQQENPNSRTQKQKERWLTEKELNTFWEETYGPLVELLKKRGPLSKTQLSFARDGVILAIHMGKGVPPPRNDWSSATWTKSSDTILDNPEDTRVFKARGGKWYVKIFGKTKAYRGATTIPIHNPLSKLLTMYYKKTGTMGQRLFTSVRGKQFTNSTYGSHLRKMFIRRFGKRVGSSLLRMLYISMKYKKLPKLLREMELDAEKMMHSSGEQQRTYLKRL